MKTIAAPLLLLLAGCAAGPDFQRPAAPDAARLIAAPIERTVSADDAQMPLAEHLPTTEVWQPEPRLSQHGTASAVMGNVNLKSGKTKGRIPCPECGQEMVPESGCWTCSNCGFSKCS